MRIILQCDIETAGGQDEEPYTSIRQMSFTAAYDIKDNKLLK